MRDSPWVLRRTDGSREEAVAVTGQFVANNAGYLLGLAVKDHGIVMCAKKMVQPDLDAHTTVRVLPDWTTQDVSIYALIGTRQLPSNVRMLVDYLAKHLPHVIEGEEGRWFTGRRKSMTSNGSWQVLELVKSSPES